MKKANFLGKSAALATAAATAVAPLAFSLVNNVSAAPVNVAVVSPASAEFDALTPTNVTFDYTASATEFAALDEITVTVTPALAGALTGCAPATLDADGDSTADGSFGGFTTTGATYTFSAATTTASTGGVDLCLNFPASTTTGNYSIAVTDSNDGDFGSTMVYVGDDNDVNVSAVVQPTLAFAIRNNVDTLDTNECDLGVLTLTAVNTCDYRLNVATNADGGYDVSVTSDGDLSKNGVGDVLDIDDIDPIAEDSTVTAGTEGYGIAFVGGSATGGVITESGDFNDDDTPIPFGSTPVLYNSAGQNNPNPAGDITNTALVTHRAAIDAATATGNYNQIVTYTVLATF